MEDPKLEINEIKEELLNQSTKPIENKPTPEDVAKAKTDFESHVADFNTKYWIISTEENALQRAKYLLEFVNTRLIWTKNAWMGVIKLNDELEQLIPKLENKEIKLFEVQYQALEFILFVLDNPSGTGVNDAKEFEKIYTFFMEFYDDVVKKAEEARKEIKEIQWLQDRWAAAEQGFFLEKEPEPEEKFEPPTSPPTE